MICVNYCLWCMCCTVVLSELWCSDHVIFKLVMPVRLLLLVSGIMWVTVGSAGRPAGRRVGLRAGSGQHFRVFAGPRAGSGHEFFYRVFFGPTRPEKCPDIVKTLRWHSSGCVTFHNGKSPKPLWGMAYLRSPLPTARIQKAHPSLWSHMPVLVCDVRVSRPNDMIQSLISCSRGNIYCAMIDANAQWLQ